MTTGIDRAVLLIHLQAAAQRYKKQMGDACAAVTVYPKAAKSANDALARHMANYKEVNDLITAIQLGEKVIR